MLEIVIALKPLLAFLNASKGLVWLTKITQGGEKSTILMDLLMVKREL